MSTLSWDSLDNSWIFFLAWMSLLPLTCLIVAFAGRLIDPVVKLGLRLRRSSQSWKEFYLSREFSFSFGFIIWCLGSAAMARTIVSRIDFLSNEIYFRRFFATLLILGFAALVWKIVRFVAYIVRAKHNINVKNNLKQRTILTQLQYVERIAFILIAVLTLGLLLLQFENFEKLGGGILASAGVVSVIVGFAAQESVSNLLAGFQIAFTQPLRIDDAVVIKDEWGWIEEITLTYVVVRLWDRRRLIVPIKKVASEVFQNWTRKESQIIGSVFLYLSYRAPVEKIRKKFEEIVSTSPLWDKDVQVMQVTDASDKTIQLRALMTGADSPTTFDLRCLVREQLIAYIQKECPEALPEVRVSFVDKGIKKSLLDSIELQPRNL